MSQRFSGKVAIVTGGGSGMGKATAVRLASLGAKVSIFDNHKPRLKKVKDEIESMGKEIVAVECDTASYSQMKNGMSEVFNHWGKLDILFANAGIAGIIAPIESMEAEEWSNTINTNLKGTFLTIKCAIPYMKNDGGSIIITSSFSGNRVFHQPGFSAYSTSKASQVALMKMTALELSNYRIRVNAICPGGVDTNIKESMQRKPEVKKIDKPSPFSKGSHSMNNSPASPEQIADVVQFLASDQSAHITGTEIYIDGGSSLLHG